MLSKETCELFSSGKLGFLDRKKKKNKPRNHEIRKKINEYVLHRPLPFLKVNVAQLCPTPCNSVGSSPPGPSVFGIFQAKILEQVAIPFYDGSDSRETACNTGDQGSIPGSGRSPGKGKCYPLHYSCLENFMDRGAWQAIVRRVAESDAPEQLTLHTIPFLPKSCCFTYMLWIYLLTH